MKLTRNVPKTKFICSGFGITYDGANSWSFANEFARNIVILLLKITQQDILKIIKITF